MEYKPARKLHFIHQFEKSYVSANLGDWVSSPYYYFLEFFSKYTCVLHSVWAVHWHEIEDSDIVVIGGGGLIDNSDALNSVINRVIEKCRHVVLWGAGTHRYMPGNVFKIKDVSIPIRFDKLALGGIRDYGHAYNAEPYNMPFLPCASCLHPAFDKKSEDIRPVRDIGIISHGLDGSFPVVGGPSSVTNAEPLSKIVEYILSSKVMLVSSYHGAYWSMLLGRKVILHASRLGIEKYRYFKYPVGVYHGDKFDRDALLEIASDLPELPDFLSEARALNRGFFEKVKEYIQNISLPSAEVATVELLSKRVAQLEFSVNELANIIRKINRQIDAK